MKTSVAAGVAIALLGATGCAETRTLGPVDASIPVKSTAEQASTGGASEGPGSLSHAEDKQFCLSHECVANFSDGHGAVVQCGDGDWSHSGGLSGACSSHGGEQAGRTSASGAAEGRSSPVDDGGALLALNHYWSAIRDHGFSAAYGYLAPGMAGMTEAQFVASEEQANIADAQFHGGVTASSGSSATIQVVSLVTHDGQFGCRAWSGSYQMTHEGGHWRIAHAALTPSSCSG